MQRPEKLQFLGGTPKSADVDRLMNVVLKGHGLLKDIPKFAFVGRSNVGKSSLLNALTHSKVARVSAEPGKTKEMNFYLWYSTGRPWILVDLPGYGYAKVSKKMRSEWGEEITRWVLSDRSIVALIALVDGRHGFMPKDVDLIKFLQAEELPFIVAFTKMDKWKSANQRKGAEKELLQKAKAVGVGADECVFVSALSDAGVQPIKNLFHVAN